MLNHCAFQRISTLLILLLFCLGVNSQTFNSVAGTHLKKTDFPASAWGDYDNDGNLDLLVIGDTSLFHPSTIVYHNNGDNTFAMVSTILYGIDKGSCVWADYNNDGFLDFAIAGDHTSDNEPVTKIYKNNQDGTFTDQNIPLIGLQEGTLNWADYNNDGFVDLLITGHTGFPYNTITTKLYKNNGNNTFSEINAGLIAVKYSQVSWADYNNDGYLDVIIGGQSSSSKALKLYKNNGNGTFTEQSTIMPIVSGGSIKWADYNNDGYLDALINGFGSDLKTFTKVFTNNAGNSFTEYSATTFAGSDMEAQWADFNNDGYTDILIAGYNSGSYSQISKIYLNNSGTSFTDLAGFSIEKEERGSLVVGDFDGEGDLDIFTCGFNGSETNAYLYKNEISTANTAATAPGSLQSTITNYDVNLTWGKATDTQTPQNGLSYNLYIYKDGQSTFYKSPNSFPQSHAKNGLRKLPEIGNIQYTNQGMTLKNLAPGTYKWSVQAIDAALKGGLFASEQSFTIVIPTLDLTNVGVDCSTSRITNTSIDFQYSLNSTDGINGTWTACSSGYTTADFSTGGMDVWIRQANLTTNTRKVAVIAAQATAPVYTIDFINEKTNEIIPVTTEYSFNSNMSVVYSGTGYIINVSPSAKLYFRVKATTTKVASAIFTLDIPARPNLILGIDFINEKTAQPISSDVEYSTNSDLSNSKLGDNTALNLVPGTKIYYKVKATNSTFASVILILNVPARPVPSYIIDYVSENAYTYSFNPDEYSFQEDMSDPQPVLYRNIHVTPGRDFYVRTKASSSNFKSNGVVQVTVPPRPAIPEYTFNTATLTVNEPIAATDQYADNPDYLNTQTGDGSRPVLESEGIIYIRTQATSSSFVSLSRVFDARSFSESQALLSSGESLFSPIWFDYNKDGYLDVLSGTRSNDVNKVKLFRNNAGNGFEEVTEAKLPAGGHNAFDVGDFNGDGLLDIVSLSLTQSTFNIYWNNGDNTFDTVKVASIQLNDYVPQVQCADMDNDGDLDIVVLERITTNNIGTSHLKIYENTGNKMFAQKSFDQGMFYVDNFTLGDIDNDGDVDILANGVGGNNSTTFLFKNSGGFLFNKTELTNAINLWFQFSKIVDFDNDGLPDLILYGSGTNYLYRNKGNGTFERLSTVLQNGWDQHIQLADLDNNGYIDILFPSSESKLYFNKGNNSYVEQTKIESYLNSSALIGDYDNDGKQDIMIYSDYYNNSINRFLHNNMLSVNQVPAAPSNLITEVNQSSVTFKWDKSTDKETPDNGLTYDIYLYKEGSSGYVIAPFAFPQTSEKNGLRTVSSQGHILYLPNGYTIKNLPTGNYKWSVQAVDAGYKGSEFAPEASFSVLSTPVNPELTQPVVNIYPNPVVSILYISNLPEKSELVIFNIDGKIQKKINGDQITNSINVDDLAPGLYILRVISNKVEYNFRFTKL